MQNGPALKDVEEALTLPLDRLAAHLGAHGLNLDRDVPVRQFAHGFGNVNYLLSVGGAKTVLRRPPLGPIPPGGNDMKREHTVLSVLWQAYPYAPKGIHFCGDESVIGAPFQLIEYREGLVIGAEMPPELAGKPEIGAKLGGELVRLMAEFHAVDSEAIGLGQFGKPEGFLERTLAGWVKRCRLAMEGPAPHQPTKAFAELVAWLEGQKVPPSAVTLLHNDFKLDNVILNPETLDPIAVLDWDMATRGDPLFDLAIMLAYWTEAGDPPAMHELKQMPTAGPGFPKRRDLVTGYGAISGRDVSDMLYYRVLGMLRLAGIFLQLNRRWREGGTKDKRFADFGTLADGLIEFGWDIARGKAF
ncbi:phosphotransferase family protein [Oceanibaculum nanhaiense]|uniref:phosphotransferase family protein n=1 Tax=Oceanibaculum nanhaiense TaxID=1909734 RepID=UPI003F700A3B